MKILVVGSDSIHVSSFVKAMSLKESELYLLSEDNCSFDGIKEYFNVSFRSLNPASVLKNNASLKKVLRELKPDVVHIHQLNRLAFFVSRQCHFLNIPVISTAWGSDVLMIPKRNRFFHYLVKKSLQRSAFVTGDSKEMIVAMNQISPDKEKYIYLQYGIDPVVSIEKEKIIYSNRLHKPLYRIDQIIRYFAEILPDYPDWILVVAGEGSETDSLKNLTKELDVESKVNFVGWLSKEQNNDWYARSSVYISIPSSDGTSVSLLEAMSAECIPIVPDLVVSREWITDKENGVIEKNGYNPIKEAFEINREKCVELNLRLINENVSREYCISRFLELYLSTVNRNKK